MGEIRRRVFNFVESEEVARFYCLKTETISCVPHTRDYYEIGKKDKIEMKYHIINNSEDIFEMLEIDFGQELSVLSGIIETNDLFEFCFDEDNFKIQKNFCRVAIYCEFFTIEKLKDHFLNQSFLYNNEISQITRFKLGYSYLFLLETENIFDDKVLREFYTIFEKLLKTDVRVSNCENSITNFENKYLSSFQAFDTQFKRLNNHKCLADVVKQIKYENRSKKRSLYQVYLKSLWYNSDYFRRNLKDIVKTFIDNKNVFKYLEKYSDRNVFTYDEQQYVSKFKIFKDEMRRSVIKIRESKEADPHFLFIDQAFKDNVSRLNKKLEIIEILEKNNMEYLDKGYVGKKYSNAVFFCYSYRLKEKDEYLWEALFGKICNMILKKRRVVVHDYDLNNEFFNETEMGLFEIIEEDKKYKPKEIEESVFLKKHKNIEIIDDKANDKVKPKEIKTKHMSKDINILLLGESGVGKSTFINALINYLKFDSLEEAKTNDYEILIPSYFTYTDDMMRMHEISVGKDKNECFIPGQSSTQSAKAYDIEIDDTIIRIIDTPGIGDVRGIDKDQKNFRETIEYVSQFDYLNAICFLLKPNNARFQQVFKYCFKELLSNLHKNVTENLLFCFTNSRSTQYRPGESLPALKRFLDEIKKTSNVEIPIKYENTFCLDNEAFRYLLLTDAKYSHIVDIDQAEEKNYANSWRKSSSESKRMLKYLKEIPIMKTEDIVYLNKSKSSIMDWAKKAVFILIKLVNSIIKEKSSLVSLSSEDKIKILNDSLKEIVSSCAILSVYVRQNAVSVFNDDFLARLDETIREQEKQEYVLATQLPLIHYLKEIKEIYKNYMSKRRKIDKNDFEECRDSLMKILKKYDSN